MESRIKRRKIEREREAYSLPGGGYKYDPKVCKGALFCKSITPLSQISYFMNRLNIKVNVIKKSEIRRGALAMGGTYEMFDFHVICDEDGVTEQYIIVFNNAQKFHQIIMPGQTYYIKGIATTNNHSQYSGLPSLQTTLQFVQFTNVFPGEKRNTIYSLEEHSLRKVGKMINRKAAEAADGTRSEGLAAISPIITRLSPVVREQLFCGFYLDFETLCLLYYSSEYNKFISSQTMAQYILTRETSHIHATEYHNDNSDLYQDLYCVFDDLEPFTLTTRDSAENVLPMLLESVSSQQTSFPIVPTLDTFKQHFKLFTRNILDGINWKNLFCAGGSVLACLLPLPRDIKQLPSDIAQNAMQSYYENKSNPYCSSDIDIFLYGLHTHNDVDAKVMEVTQVIQKNLSKIGQESCVVRTRNTVTVVAQHPYRLIQLVIFPLQSPSAVLTRFDIDCVCFGYDGNKVYASQRGIRAITRRYNLLDPDRLHDAYAYRLYKYSKRGFSVAVPGLNTAQIDYVALVRQAGEHQQLLRHLLLLDMRFRKLLVPHAAEIIGEGDQVNNNNNDFPQYSAYIPWGPEQTILKAFAHAAKNPETPVALTFSELFERRYDLDYPYNIYSPIQPSRPVFVEPRFKLGWDEAPFNVPVDPQQFASSVYYQRFHGHISNFVNPAV